TRFSRDWSSDVCSSDLKTAALGFAESHNEYSVQKFKTPPRVSNGIVIYETWGKTEAKVVNGSVDLGLEITQSGSALRNYGLAIRSEERRVGKECSERDS